MTPFFLCFAFPPFPPCARPSLLHSKYLSAHRYILPTRVYEIIRSDKARVPLKTHCRSIANGWLHEDTWGGYESDKWGTKGREGGGGDEKIRVGGRDEKLGERW